MFTNGGIRAVTSLALAIGLSGAMALPAAAEPTRPAEQATNDACSGDFRYSGGDSQRAARDAAIDGVVSDMNFFVRGIARSRLKKATKISPSVAVSRDGENLVVLIDGKRYSAPLSGKGVEVTNAEGDKMTLTHREKNGRIDQTFRAKDGGRKNMLRCQGDKLELQVTIFSPRLPREIKYRLSYKK